MKDYKIMIVGVGGQGTLKASKLLGKLFLAHGYDVKVSEVHGMSQRGGSVVTYVCCGKKAYSPVIDRGEADIIVSFELLEAARWVPYLKKGGRILTNVQQIDPMPVITGAAKYPEEIGKSLAEAGIELDAIDAYGIAERLSSVRSANMVLMGKLSLSFDFAEEEWLNAVAETVPEKTIAVNQEAFKAGRNS